jgi:hypothetical protein
MPFSHGANYPYTVGGNFPHTDANNLEDGVAALYPVVESITGNDGVTQPSSNGPFSLATFINNIVKQIKNITGKANWYTAPATSIETLKTTTDGHDALTVNDGITLPSSDGPFTLANLASYFSKVIRNITGAANWYDTPAATLSGLNTNKANLSGAAFTGAVTRSGNTIWDAGNDGSGSGLDADLLDGKQATDFPLVGSGGGFANRTIGVGPIGSRPAAGNKGAVYIETPFS